MFGKRVEWKDVKRYPGGGESDPVRRTGIVIGEENDLIVIVPDDATDAEIRLTPQAVEVIG